MFVFQQFWIRFDLEAAAEFLGYINKSNCGILDSRLMLLIVHGDQNATFRLEDIFFLSFFLVNINISLCSFNV